MAEIESTPVIANVLLRAIVEEDLAFFFEHQLDPAANFMAAFTAKDPSDREGFNNHWAKVMGDKSILIKSILYNGEVAGHVLSHGWFGPLEVSYWLGRDYWGMGIATRALSEFLSIQKVRPLFARAAKDNLPSIRVLEKCGFKITGHDRGFANARGEEIDEVILELR